VLPLKLAIDAWYVRNSSPAIDLLVLAALARRFFGSPHKGALYARVAAAVPEAAMLTGGRGGLSHSGDGV